MDTIIAACKACRGDGIRVVTDAPQNAYVNVAGLAPYQTERGMIWKGKCVMCDGRGFFEWTRGRSLTPLVRR